MEITAVQIELTPQASDRLRAFCRIVFDNEFMVRDIRVLEGKQGYFVAMPSRKVMRPCESCREKNQLAAQFCNHCGKALRPPAAGGTSSPDQRAFADIAHPINPACREKIHQAILKAFQEEVGRSKVPAPHYLARPSFDSMDLRDAGQNQLEQESDDSSSGIGPPTN